MKNSTRRFFFVVAAILLALFLIPFAVQAQEASAVTSGGFFAKVKDWIALNAIEYGVVFIGGILAKGGWTLLIKKIAKKGALVMKELGEFCGDSATFLIVLDQAIKEDGSIKQNSVQEVLSAGREVIGELKDVTISIKPKV